MQRIEADRIPATPWRNGGGRTRELYTWPAGADWQLRISLADIEQDGPFSAFPGVQRHFAVLQGAGVRLQLPEGERLLRAGDAPLAFDGAAAPGCRLLDGATRDLNLMLQGVDGAMRLADDEPWSDEGCWRALFVAGAAYFQGQLLAPRTLLVDLPAGPLRLTRLDAAPAFWIAAQTRG